MAPADITAALEVEAAVQPRPWTRELLTEELAQPTRTYRAAWLVGASGADDGDARLVGFGGILVAVEELHVTNIAVAPQAQRRGVGARLLLSLLEVGIARGARAATLEVRAGNTTAQRLYARFGFAPVGVRPGYYAATGEDAVIMWAHDIDGEAYARTLRRRTEEVGA